MILKIFLNFIAFFLSHSNFFFFSTYHINLSQLSSRCHALNVHEKSIKISVISWMLFRWLIDMQFLLLKERFKRLLNEWMQMRKNNRLFWSTSNKKWCKSKRIVILMIDSNNDSKTVSDNISYFCWTENCSDREKQKNCRKWIKKCETKQEFTYC